MVEGVELCNGVETNGKDWISEMEGQDRKGR